MKQYKKDNKKKLIEYNRQWRKNNRKRLREKFKQWCKDNPRKILEYRKQWEKNNPEYYKQWRKDNPDKIKKYGKKWYKNNIKKIRQWYKNNSEKMMKYHNQWVNARYKINLKFNLNYRMRTAIGLSLKRNKAGRGWEKLVGYTLSDLIRRLKKTMPEEYTWKDYLKGKLHIDHIIPIKVFNFTKPEHTDFKRCWALSNLQLLSAKENNIKRAKLDKPFQSALQLNSYEIF